MEIESLKLVADIAPWLSIVLLTAYLVLWFRFRTGTSYGLLNRLYAIVTGGREFHNPAVTEFWNERKDVEHFNALFNTRAKSIKEVNQFIKWVDRNELDFQKLTKLNDLFDMEKREVRKGYYRLASAYFFGFTLILAMFSVVLCGLAVKDAALVKFKDETQWMWLKHDAAYSIVIKPFQVSDHDWRITPDLCLQKQFDIALISTQSKLKPANVLNICQFFTDIEQIERINKTINNQKSFVWLAFSILLFSLFTFNKAVRMKSAYQAKLYLEHKFRDDCVVQE